MRIISSFQLLWQHNYEHTCSVLDLYMYVLISVSIYLYISLNLLGIY